MREKAEAKAKAKADGTLVTPVKSMPKKPMSEMTLQEQLVEQQRIMREKAEAKAKAIKEGKVTVKKTEAPRELSFAE